MLELIGYSDLRLIHQSSNSHVYRAIRDRDGIKVALKTPAQIAPSARKLSSMSREFEILCNHTLTNIPKALELIDAGPSMVLVLEYVEAPALRDYISTSPMQLDIFFTIALQVTEILVTIHRQDLIHRDLSPGNILYNPADGTTRIIDFGAALEFPRHARAVINPSSIEGSPPYMSPEQTGRLNRGLDYRTDFYSLGVIFFRLLTGRLPFTATDHNELVHCHIAQQPQAPHCLIKEVPRPLSEMVLKLMSKNAEDRYQSAEGIRADLRKFTKLATNNGLKDVIELATEDIKDRFILSEKLYGREAELHDLFNLYLQTVDGQGRMVFISGHSGVGKTSLVKELYKPLAENGGYIASGKFDQYQRHQPYTGLTEAFSSFIRQILAESDARVSWWRENILAALGPNALLLIDVIPDLELLIGPQAEVDELPVAEAQTRFNNVFRSFWDLLVNVDVPLILFLDDLHLIDAPSLSLLEEMATAIGNKKLMLIGAYRSNEVPETHRLAISLRELRKSGTSFTEIELRELSPDSLIEFLSDTLNLSAAKLNPLNDVLLQKTRGNPLFFKTMLDNLHIDGLIWFDYAQKSWTWDQKAVCSTPYAANVVDMLQDRIPSLAGGHANMLGMGACLGNVFELEHLARLAKVSRAKAARDLQPSVSAGLLQPQGGDYELLMMQRARNLPGISFRFTHDRIQQAAYMLISDVDKPVFHLQIGRLLLSELGEGESGQKLFAATANLNQGSALMEDDERCMLAHLNLRAGKKAKESAAFNEAQACLLAAQSLLEEDCWQVEYELTLAVHLELAEACYLVGDFDKGENLYKLIRESSKNVNDILALINIQAKQYHHQGRYPEAIKLEIEGLGLLGIDLPQDDAELFALFMAEGKKIDEMLGGGETETLFNRPEITSPLLTRTHELLFDLFADGYLMGHGALLACAAAISTRLSMEHGTCAMTSIGYINYGTCLCAGGNYLVGHGFGRVAVKLADRYRVAGLKNYTYHLFALSINHWLEPLESSYSYWREASKLALESGSPYAGWVFLQLAHVLLASGAPLDRVEEQITESRHYLTRAGLNDIAFMLELIVAQPVKHLRGRTKDIRTLDDDQFNCDQLMKQHREALFFLSHIPYSMLRATLIGRNIQSMEIMAEWMPMFEQTMQGQFIHADCYFYYTLHLAAGYKEIPKELQTAYLLAIDENLERFRNWAELCPANFEHKYLLIAAERKRLSGDALDAMELYDNAIDAAYASSFMQDAALANELAGLFWLGKDKPRLAGPYLEQSLAAYGRWGASGKVTQLKKAYPGLTSKTSGGMSPSDDTITSSETRDFSAQLDLMSIIKASQAVSQHVVLDKLAGELVDLAMQNAGATKAVLLLRQNDSFVEVMCGRVADKVRESGLEADITQDKNVSPMVMNYVIRSGESVVVDDGLADTRFNRCEYIGKYGPKSICCIPILKQKEVRGVLYLENSRMSAAFHKDRLKVLRVIAAQAAISLENVNIYKKLDDMNKNLEHKVMARTRELNIKNRELEILSTTDQLTGLYNRRYIDQSIKEEIDRSRRYKVPLSIILLDIDHFKRINDTYGHDVGDEVLVSLASVLKENTRNTDIAGRWGGEEFLIIVPQTDGEMCLLITEKLREAMKSCIYQTGEQVTASFGVTEFQKNDSVSLLIKKADQALYEAKKGGRDKVVLYTDKT